MQRNELDEVIQSLNEEKPEQLDVALLNLKKSKKSNEKPFPPLYQNQTLLINAIRLNKPFAIGPILKHFPDLLHEKTHKTVSKTNPTQEKKKEGMTPLMVAVSLGHANCADELLKNGANRKEVEAKPEMEKSKKQKFSLFETAILFSDNEMVTVLTKHGARLNPNIVDLGIIYSDDTGFRESADILRRKLQQPAMLDALLAGAKKDETYTYYLTKFKTVPLTVQEFGKLKDPSFFSFSNRPSFKELKKTYQIESKDANKKLGLFDNIKDTIRSLKIKMTSKEPKIVSPGFKAMRKKAREKSLENFIQSTSRKEAEGVQASFKLLDDFALTLMAIVQQLPNDQLIRDLNDMLPLMYKQYITGEALPEIGKKPFLKLKEIVSKLSPQNDLTKQLGAYLEKFSYFDPNQKVTSLTKTITKKSATST